MDLLASVVAHLHTWTFRTFRKGQLIWTQLLILLLPTPDMGGQIANSKT